MTSKSIKGSSKKINTVHLCSRLNLHTGLSYILGRSHWDWTTLIWDPVNFITPVREQQLILGKPIPIIWFIFLKWYQPGRDAGSQSPFWSGVAPAGGVWVSAGSPLTAGTSCGGCKVTKTALLRTLWAAGSQSWWRLSDQTSFLSCSSRYCDEMMLRIRAIW